VTGLWDSWEADAFVHDKASGQFYDPAKLHVLNHRGKHFSVRGPLNAPPTPQGRPILVQAGAAEQGQEIAAANADVVYAAQVDLAGAKAYYAGLKARMAKYGRAPDLLKVMPAVTTIVGRTRAEAQAKFDQLQELIDPLVGLASLFNAFGDLSGHPLDGPVPEPVNAKVRSIAYNMWNLAQRENLSIRQFYQKKPAMFIKEGGRQRPPVAERHGRGRRRRAGAVDRRGGGRRLQPHADAPAARRGGFRRAGRARAAPARPLPQRIREHYAARQSRPAGVRQPLRRGTPAHRASERLAHSSPRSAWGGAREADGGGVGAMTPPSPTE